MSSEFVHSWVDSSPYTLALGVKLEALTETAATLALPYRDSNSNPGKALHGGVAASLSVVGSHAVARASLGESSGPWHTVGFQINYLAAAIGEDLVAETRLLRRGKQLCFAEVEIRTQEAKSISHATLAVRGRFGQTEADLVKATPDEGASDPGVIGPQVSRVPFIGARGISVEHMAEGSSRLVMPWRATNGDLAGGVHEGALLALLDTAGAMAAWGQTGAGAYKASTPAIQAQILAPPVEGDLLAYGHVVQRDGELFWSAVDVAAASDGRLLARGTVIYRIVT